MSKRFKKTIVYPVFTKCADHCKDDFWKQLFEDLAYSKTPKNVIIQNHQIICTNGKKSTSKLLNSYDFSHKSDTEIYKELIPFLQNNSSIFSTKDLKKKKKVINEIRLELEEQKLLKWSQIKNNNVKKILLLDFAIDIKNKYKWDWNKAKIFLNYVVHYIKKQGSSNMVYITDGKITSVEGLEYENFKLDIFSDVVSEENKYKNTKKDNRWCFYIKKHLKSINEMLN